MAQIKDPTSCTQQFTVIGANGVVYGMTYTFRVSGVINTGASDEIFPSYDVTTGSLITGNIIPPNRGDDGGGSSLPTTVTVSSGADLDLNIEQKLDFP